MKMRNDSPFACMTPLEQSLVLDAAEVLTIDQLADEMERIHPGLEFSRPALARFVRGLREEQLREETEDSEETMEAFAKSGRDGRARDGMVEALRRKMYGQGLDSKSPNEAALVYSLMRGEQSEDRKLKLEERRMALEEENARQEWRAKELAAAASALKLLPRIRELLCEESEGTAEERLAKARELFMVGGAKLLSEGNG